MYLNYLMQEFYAEQSDNLQLNQKWTATRKTANPSRWMQPISRELRRFRYVPHHGADPNVPAARRIM